jgi:hypothetical protein
VTYRARIRLNYFLSLLAMFFIAFLITACVTLASHEPMTVQCPSGPVPESLTKLIDDLNACGERA